MDTLLALRVSFAAREDTADYNPRQPRDRSGKFGSGGGGGGRRKKGSGASTIAGASGVGALAGAGIGRAVGGRSGKRAAARFAQRRAPMQRTANAWARQGRQPQGALQSLFGPVRIPGKLRQQMAKEYAQGTARGGRLLGRMGRSAGTARGGLAGLAAGAAIGTGVALSRRRKKKKRGDTTQDFFRRGPPKPPQLRATPAQRERDIRKHMEVWGGTPQQWEEDFGEDWKLMEENDRRQQQRYQRKLARYNRRKKRRGDAVTRKGTLTPNARRGTGLPLYELDPGRTPGAYRHWARAETQGIPSRGRAPRQWSKKFAAPRNPRTALAMLGVAGLGLAGVAAHKAHKREKARGSNPKVMGKRMRRHQLAKRQDPGRSQDFNPSQPRDRTGKFGSGGGKAGVSKPERRYRRRIRRLGGLGGSFGAKVLLPEAYAARGRERGARIRKRAARGLARAKARGR